MGTQDKHARMPLPPEHVARHVVPLWDTRAQMLALDYRKTREMLRLVTGAQLTQVLDAMRRHVASDYRAAVFYRAALNEAVTVRHWTVTWSALTGSHEIS